MSEIRRKGSDARDHLAAFLDACYAVAAPADDWVRGVAAAGDVLLGDGLGVAVAGFAPNSPQPVCFGTASCDPQWSRRFLSRVAERHDDVSRFGDPLAEASRRVHAACRALGPYARLQKRIDPVFEHAIDAWEGARDLVSVHAWDASGEGIWLGFGRRRNRPLSPRQQALYALVSRHLATALRVRRSGAFTPAATIVGNALARAHASTGTEVALRIEETRRPVRTVLVEGQPWTLAFEQESEGRRLLVLLEAEDPAGRLRRLTARERQVLAECARGHHTKLVAYDLGLSPATVRVLLGRAARKLGVTTREAALDVFRRYGSET